NDVTLTVTSSNPHVTFPQGNLLYFPPVQKNGVSTGSIQVALNGAVAIETTDFQIAIASPELSVPPFNVVSTHRLNYDEQLQGSATESVESANHASSITGGLKELQNVDAWQRRALSPTQHVCWGPDNNGQIDDQRAEDVEEQILVFPPLRTETGRLPISFQHPICF